MDIKERIVKRKKKFESLEPHRKTVVLLKILNDTRGQELERMKLAKSLGTNANDVRLFMTDELRNYATEQKFAKANIDLTKLNSDDVKIILDK